MNNSSLTNLIHSILNEQNRLAIDLQTMMRTNLASYPDIFIDRAGSAIKRSEAITRSVRQLVPSFNPKVDEYLKHESIKNLSIEISHKENIVTIILPGLMPTRGFGYKTDFITGPLYFALSEYNGKNELPHLQSAVVSFTHIYNPALARRQLKDYDNLECKQVLDIVTNFTLPDDGGCYCRIFHQLGFGPVDQTRIDIVATAQFGEWYMQNVMG